MYSVVYGVPVYGWPSLLAVNVMLDVAALAAATLPPLHIATIDRATTRREE